MSRTSIHNDSVRTWVDKVRRFSAVSIRGRQDQDGFWLNWSHLNHICQSQHVFRVLLFVNLPSARATAAMAASSGRHKTLGHLWKRMPESWSVNNVSHATCVMTAQAKSTSEVHIIDYYSKVLCRGGTAASAVCSASRRASSSCADEHVNVCIFGIHAVIHASYLGKLKATASAQPNPNV